MRLWSESRITSPLPDRIAAAAAVAGIGVCRHQRAFRMFELFLGCFLLRSRFF